MYNTVEAIIALDFILVGLVVDVLVEGCLMMSSWMDGIMGTSNKYEWVLIMKTGLLL